jgi:DNA-binding protein YbaB
MDTDHWLAQYKDKVNGLKQAAADLEQNIAAATVTVSSPDEAVTVTIGPNGSLRDLKFSNRISEHSPTALAALVLKTVGRGQRAVAEKVVEAFAPVGAGTSAMNLLTSFVPEEDDSAEQPPANAYDELVSDAPQDVPPAPAQQLPPAAPPQPMPAATARPRRTPQPTPTDDDFDDEERPW